MNSNPLFSVIIATYHRNDLLAKCLDCLAPGVQTLPLDRYEVIVTDDGSQTTAEDMILERYPWAKWVAGPRKGPAANRNNGVQYAQGEWLAFIDDDCLPEPNWLSAFGEATTGSPLALEGAIHPLGDPNQDLAECPVNLTGGAFWSANIAVQRSLFEKVGGFDHNYPLAAYEDIDLYLRLSPLTIIPFIPDARVFHPVRLRSLKELLTRIPKRGAAWTYHLNKHRKALGYKNRLGVTIFQYKSSIGALLDDLRDQKFKYAFSWLVMLIVGIPLALVYFRPIEDSCSTQKVRSSKEEAFTS